ncbi:hypothetical protein Bca52824_082562 [Brassica carinata]|uniref:Uncharacterized protein n=1 Tax=Brassica carinata TaxID=52824 RepID=A0A8X7TUD2_BRACI|nr:hypothetical protein Bca52824_082562 [Brassica carinata]
MWKDFIANQDNSNGHKCLCKAVAPLKLLSRDPLKLTLSSLRPSQVQGDILCDFAIVQFRYLESCVCVSQALTSFVCLSLSLKPSSPDKAALNLAPLAVIVFKALSSQAHTLKFLSLLKMAKDTLALVALIPSVHILIISEKT